MSVIIRTEQKTIRKQLQMLQQSDIHIQDQGRNSERNPREYVRPTLRVFGPVGALTQSGSNNGTEMVMMNGECSLGQMNMC